MAVTVSVIEQVSIAGLQGIAEEFGVAGAWFEVGGKDYGTRVARKLAAGSAWTGDGLPEASSVVRTNGLALSIAALRMETGKNAVAGLTSAMSTAHNRLLAALADAKENHVTVADDGSAQRSDDVPGTVDAMGNPDGDNLTATLAAPRIEREVKGILRYVAAADNDATVLLDRIGTSLPASTDVADPRWLAHNADLYGSAIDDLLDSESMRDYWRDTSPEALPKNDPVGDWLGENGEAVGEFSRGLALSIGGATLTALGGVGVVGGGGATVLSGGTVAAVSVPVTLASVSAVAGGVAMAGKGAGSMNTALSKMHSPSSKSPTRYLRNDQGRTRSYAKSTGDAKGQAGNYARKMKARGYRVEVPPVRYGKYGHSDVTVTVLKKGPNGGWQMHHIRHFIYKG
ncbi:MAG: hypothetical protein GEV10_20275 [Streptosporangiales bacterium]|nr:hypothetical protein [Streptosporangiales bacterium]